jgi:hypothetical protein
MQSIDYVARAKALIRSHARSAALVIAPLAAAVSAHAGSINLPTGNYTCSYTVDGASGGGGNCSGGAYTLAGSGSQIGGTRFYLSGGLDLGSSGGSILMTASGTVGQALASGTVIPVAWDFELTALTDPPWTLTYTLGDITTSTILATGEFSGNNSGTVTNTGMLTTTAASSSGDNIGLKVLLTEAGDPEGGVDVQVEIPHNGSLDFNPIGNSSVPEPSTLGLLGSGLAGLGYLWRKRRKA